MLTKGGGSQRCPHPVLGGTLGPRTKHWCSFLPPHHVLRWDHSFSRPCTKGLRPRGQVRLGMSSHVSGRRYVITLVHFKRINLLSCFGRISGTPKECSWRRELSCLWLFYIGFEKYKAKIEKNGQEKLTSDYIRWLNAKGNCFVRNTTFTCLNPVSWKDTSGTDTVRIFLPWV